MARIAASTRSVDAMICPLQTWSRQALTCLTFVLLGCDEVHTVSLDAMADVITLDGGLGAEAGSDALESRDAEAALETQNAALVRVCSAACRISAQVKCPNSLSQADCVTTCVEEAGRCGETGILLFECVALLQPSDLTCLPGIGSPVLVEGRCTNQFNEYAACHWALAGGKSRVEPTGRDP